MWQRPESLVKDSVKLYDFPMAPLAHLGDLKSAPMTHTLKDKTLLLFLQDTFVLTGGLGYLQELINHFAASHRYVKQYLVDWPSHGACVKGSSLVVIAAQKKFDIAPTEKIGVLKDVIPEAYRHPKKPVAIHALQRKLGVELGFEYSDRSPLFGVADWNGRIPPLEVFEDGEYGRRMITRNEVKALYGVDTFEDLDDLSYCVPGGVAEHLQKFIP